MKHFSTLGINKTPKTTYIQRIGLVKMALPFLMLIATFSIRAQTNSNTVLNGCGVIIIPISSTDNTATETTVDFLLVIRNTGTTTNEFLLATSNIKSKIKNPDDTDVNTNQDLKSELFDKDGLSVSKLKIEPDKDIELTVRIYVPTGAKPKVWNCTQLKISSTACPSNETFLSLFTFVPAHKNAIEGYVPFGHPIIDSHFGMLLISKSESC